MAMPPNEGVWSLRRSGRILPPASGGQDRQCLRLPFPPPCGTPCRTIRKCSDSRSPRHQTRRLCPFAFFVCLWRIKSPLHFGGFCPHLLNRAARNKYCPPLPCVLHAVILFVFAHPVDRNSFLESSLHHYCTRPFASLG